MRKAAVPGIGGLFSQFPALATTMLRTRGGTGGAGGAGGA